MPVRRIVMDIGACSPLLIPVERVLTRRFPDEMVDAWVVHNIEEVGYLEELLPDLCPEQEAAVATGAR